VAAAAAAVLALSLAFRGEGAAVGRGFAAPGAWYSAEGGEPLSVRFADRSSMRLSPGADARILEIGEHSARVLIERGTARMTVVHRPGTDWRVEVGPYAVSVKGTVFDVSWDPGNKVFSLAMHSGAVEVDGPLLAARKRIAGGEVLTIWLREARYEIALGEVVPAPEPEAKKSASPTAEAPPREAPGEARTPRGAGRGTAKIPPARDKPTTPSGDFGTAQPVERWGELNRRGEFDAVVRRAEERGVDAVLGTSDASDLLALADAARLEERWDLAESAYVAVHARFPKTKASATAAFSLGRMAFDQQHLYEKAARWLATYLDEQAAGPLAAAALGRLVEARKNAGDDSGARAAAVEYLRRFPDGPHAALAASVAEGE